MRRVGGLGFGVATHALFFYTVYRLFRFLNADTEISPRGSLALDAVLLGQFALLHSLLMYPLIRRRLCRYVPSAFYGCSFCLVTCLSLLAMFAGWKSVEPTLWRLTGWPDRLVESAFCASWGALFYSLYLAGLGYQTGFTPWWDWIRNRPPDVREFRPGGLYLWIRHPVYLSFLGLLWFNPVMSLDRMLLAVCWSGYIFIGSYLKDERLAYLLGDSYRAYQQRVPGYPLIPFGPLARRKPRPDEERLTVGRAFRPIERRAA
ncbi:MAG: methyltransferase family protein [Planctomycetaceae bacterium]